MWLICAALLAQAAPFSTGPVPPAMRQAIERIFENAGKNPKPHFAPPAVTPERPPVCSVPLIEMKVPENVTFTMRTVKPAAAMAPMPSVNVAAPPCKR